MPTTLRRERRIWPTWHRAGRYLGCHRTRASGHDCRRVLGLGLGLGGQYAHLRHRQLHPRRLLLGCARPSPPARNGGGRVPCLGAQLREKPSHAVRYTCARHCAGYGNNGRLGIANGNFSTVTVPVPVATTAGVSSGWASVSAGNQHTCAIADFTRTAYCWGAPAPAPLHGGGGGDSLSWELRSERARLRPYAAQTHDTLQGTRLTAAWASG